MKYSILGSIIIYALTLLSFQSNGQSISALGTGKIVELESAQSKVTGTFIAVSMERSLNNATKVLIHKSVDNANTWSFIDSIVPDPGDTEIPDPVITSDAVGNFYVAIMRVNNTNGRVSLTVDIEVYTSTDDGQTWTLSSIPHLSDYVADYPQIIAKNNGELFLVYTYLPNFPLTIESHPTYLKSVDGGVSWSTKTFLGEETIRCIGPDISLGFNSQLLISLGDMGSSSIHHYVSSDDGDSWDSLAPFHIANNESAHITKPITNPLLNFYGIISHKPHIENTAIFYHSSIDGIQNSQLLGTGSYAQGYITNDGIVHVVYNKSENDLFKVMYTYSKDSGLTFTNPIPVYSQDYSNSAAGEYQSLIYGNDDLFYLTFCDWSDNSTAKTLVFPPLFSLSTTDLDPIASSFIISPNPVFDVFTIHLLDNTQLLNVKILDLTGKIVHKRIIPEGKQWMHFDISHLEQATYLVYLESETKILIQKIIKH